MSECISSHLNNSYKSLAEFFSRPLKENARVIHKDGLVSPVDAKVVSCGPVVNEELEQVKGLNYDLDSFFGTKLAAKFRNKNLFYCVLYLAPGDYHRVHSPTEWQIEARIHFPGIF